MAGIKRLFGHGSAPAVAATPRSLRQNLALAAALSLLVSLMLPPNSAEAGVGLSVTPTFPTSVTVGQTGVPATLSIVNNSTDDEASGTLTVTSIRLTPSCSDPFDTGCDDPGSVADPGTFTLSGTGTGGAGTACEGETFTITTVNPATGEVEFVPAGGPVILQQPALANDLDTCVIEFSFSVNKVPNHDASAAAGIQTAQVGFVTAVSELTGLPGSGTGTDITTVLQAVSEIATQVSATSGQLGDSFTDTATLTGAVNPTGTITFNVYGPDDVDCTGAPVFTDVQPVAGDGATSAPFTPTAPGDYRWIATYSGDANNTAVSGACNDPNEILRVLDIGIVKTADPPSLPAPGGDFTFTVVVTNPNPFPLTITSLVDDVYGDLATHPEPNTCDDLIGTTLAAGASSDPCSFVGEFTGDPGDSQTDTVTVVGEDDQGNTATADDDATVTLTTPPPPEISVDKTADPLTREAPGGDFTFTVIVTNTGPIPLTITSLTDDVYGDLATRGEPNTCDDLIGTRLAPGESTAPCSFTGPFTGAAGDSQTDIVTVVGTDDFDRTVTDDDDAVVSLTPAPPPEIQVEKTADPPSMQVPGGDFTFTVVVTNPGVRPITITSLTDDIYGDLGTDANPNISDNTCDDLIGTTLAPGESSEPCSFVGEFTSDTAGSQTDVVTVVGTDATGATVTDDDDATVTLFLPDEPQIDIVKTADPLTRMVPGGTFTFTVVVTNPGLIPIEITSLTDDVYGDLGTDANPNITNNTCDDLIGTTLAPGASTAPCSFDGQFTNATPASQTDVVTVTGVDEFDRTVTADDDAIVTLVPLPPIQIVVDKTASPLSRQAPGGDFTFTVVVTNPGTEPLTITSLTDDIYGDLATRGEPNTCDDLIGTVLAAGASTAPCSFVGEFTGAAGDSQTDIVTVVGTDQFGQTATDSDDAVVTITPRPVPQILVDKTASPSSRLEPGGTFTFSVVVSNPGTEPVVITSLTDDIYGDLGTDANPNITDNTCDDLIGATVAPGASTAPCSFAGQFTGAAGQSQTDIVTVVGVDEIGQTVTDSDDAVVTITPRPAGPLAIVVDKTATPQTRLEPGGSFDFTVVITNASDVRLTITSITDDIYGDLGTRGGSNTCDDLIGVVLEPGASVSCVFSGNFFGNAGDRQTDVVTVTGRDDQGRTVDDDDDATVELIDVLPRIQVIKTATPLEREAPGGNFTFRVEVRNPGTEDIVLTDLVDDIYGDLNGRGSCATGVTIPAGQSYICQFAVEFTGRPGQSQTDIVEAIGRDDEGNEVSDRDDAVIKLVAPPPPQASPSPPPPPAPAPPPPPPPPSAPLARTGSDFLPFLALALALISAGLVLKSNRAAVEGFGQPSRRRRGYRY